MVQFIAPPDPRELLPPLLACLPTAFVSPRPPPAFLPLLSPILRQRVQLLSATSSDSSSWLPLLSWDAQRAAKLPQIVERMQVEPHPVSGEIEVEDISNIKYRRLDQETLHSRLELAEFDLVAIYLWCVNDPAGAGGGSGWRLAEVRALEDKEDGTEWYGSMDEADEGAKASYMRDALRGDAAANGSANRDSAAAQEEDDDDDYWNSYDRTPGRTPARTPAKRSPAPTGNTNVQPPSTSELEYFARYAAEVQPALDAHDPDEEQEGVESTLNGDAVASTQRPGFEPKETDGIGATGFDSSLPPAQMNGMISSATEENSSPFEELSHPRPESPASAGSVERLESQAAEQTRAEVGIKQHISTDIKSLFRLARTVGIQRDEFQRIVQTELDCLSMMDPDE
ncbi:hypothetical protein K490DRAFT_73108 [Saccharata proteae CBS 121410]|uniref:Uncharacterized protein n=1 Tax=Saccharata proteae CBS 121410 TaxID=1314787 RepID=A0A9P4HWI9_9PEZI|nr:hypothetical protein K490DRAFT_73108 [Saccharata proteae CBS 121410]